MPPTPLTCVFLSLLKFVASLWQLHHLNLRTTVPLNLNFTNARAHKATARNIHSNALE